MKLKIRVRVERFRYDGCGNNIFQTSYLYIFYIYKLERMPSNFFSREFVLSFILMINFPEYYVKAV